MKKNTCRKMADGRARHYFSKVAGIFQCTRCGMPSDPTRRWEREWANV